MLERICYGSYGYDIFKIENGIEDIVECGKGNPVHWIIRTKDVKRRFKDSLVVWRDKKFEKIMKILNQKCREKNLRERNRKLKEGGYYKVDVIGFRVEERDITCPNFDICNSHKYLLRLNEKPLPTECEKGICTIKANIREILNIGRKKGSKPQI